MPDRVMPGPVHENASEAVCIHTRKIYDSCKDKDCIEDLFFYPEECSIPAIENAVSVRPKSAQLLYTTIDVEEIIFNKGFYTVDIRFFYKVKGDAFLLTNNPVEITGFCVFDKRVILFGSEGSAKIFRSDNVPCCIVGQNSQCANLPTAVVEAVDPILLNMKLSEVDNCGNDNCGIAVPDFIAGHFSSPLSFVPAGRRVYVTLGQFSIARLERDAQLLMPAYDYFMPEKECTTGGGEDPCALFSRINFPIDEFFPPDTLEFPSGYREVKANFTK